MANTQTLEDMEKLVIQWAEDRNIFEKSNPLKQIEKTQEELTETRDALVKLTVNGRNTQWHDEAVDGIGDQLVTLIILARQIGVDLNTCLAEAYSEIADRKGSMVNGTFVKEEV